MARSLGLASPRNFELTAAAIYKLPICGEAQGLGVPGRLNYSELVLLAADALVNALVMCSFSHAIHVSLASLGLWTLCLALLSGRRRS